MSEIKRNSSLEFKKALGFENLFYFQVKIEESGSQLRPSCEEFPWSPMSSCSSSHSAQRLGDIPNYRKLPVVGDVNVSVCINNKDKYNEYIFFLLFVI